MQVVKLNPFLIILIQWTVDLVSGHHGLHVVIHAQEIVHVYVTVLHHRVMENFVRAIVMKLKPVSIIRSAMVRRVGRHSLCLDFGKLYKVSSLQTQEQRSIEILI